MQCLKKTLSSTFDIKEMGGVFLKDTIWWSMVSFPQVDSQGEVAALKLHKKELRPRKPSEINTTCLENIKQV